MMDGNVLLRVYRIEGHLAPGLSVEMVRKRLTGELGGQEIVATSYLSPVQPGAGTYCFWVAFASESRGMTEIEVQSWDSFWRVYLKDPSLPVPSYAPLSRDGVALLHLLEQRKTVAYLERQLEGLEARNKALEAELDEVDAREAQATPRELQRLEEANKRHLAMLEQERAAANARLQRAKSAAAANAAQLEGRVQFWKDKCTRHEESVQNLTEIHELQRLELEKKAVEIAELRRSLDK
jgi:hypothetical protein